MKQHPCSAKSLRPNKVPAGLKQQPCNARTLRLSVSGKGQVQLAKGWHGRVEVTPHVHSQLAVETDGGLEWEIVGAFREEEVGSVGGDWCGEEVADETWSVVTGEACGIWVPGSWTWKVGERLKIPLADNVALMDKWECQWKPGPPPTCGSASMKFQPLCWVRAPPHNGGVWTQHLRAFCSYRPNGKWQSLTAM